MASEHIHFYRVIADDLLAGATGKLSVLIVLVFVSTALTRTSGCTNVYVRMEAQRQRCTHLDWAISMYVAGGRGAVTILPLS